MTGDSHFWTEAQIAQLTRLRALGRSQTQIAMELGLSRGQVSGKLMRLNLPVPTRLKVPKTEPPRLPRLPPILRAPRPEITGDPVPLLEADERHCRALFDAPGPNRMRMCCGMPAASGRSYCEAHCELYFRPVEQRSHHGKASYRE